VVGHQKLNICHYYHPRSTCSLTRQLGVYVIITIPGPRGRSPESVIITIPGPRGRSPDSSGFMTLAGYIGVRGTPQNVKSEPIAMTAPVVCKENSRPIAMTAPVVCEGNQRSLRHDFLKTIQLMYANCQCTFKRSSIGLLSYFKFSPYIHMLKVSLILCWCCSIPVFACMLLTEMTHHFIVMLW
jgi:hypothetical protein